ncbi:uncharacterized protein LOC105276478 isoform X2 [Ooceraea biroi]|uniref:VWFC domain-containing protein n=1 Tax=Ooceraea biroi TaxID=2015173 RepID=A0A026WTD4_OOCBI|nr:uncharacterized protein LOC105276478 isoform X2 [Ooceraea biroi]EZA58364.1 hypothetical protein X777_01321 [Ooceraea biroi]
MARRVSPVQIYACLAFVVAIVAAGKKCDQSKCPGPLAYYKSLHCTPVYKNKGDCCAIKYNCDHLKIRSPDKCYVNDNVYEIGDKLKPEDANPCDIGCTCSRGYDNVATFVCAVVDCFFKPIYSNPTNPTTNYCYKRNDPTKCCGGSEEVCPKTPEDRATCIVDGVTYKDGEYFNVKDKSELTCVCRPGYKGKNVEPFCIKPKRSYCSPDFRGAGNIYHNCAPVYGSSELPQANCTFDMRCQNDKDIVIRKHDNLKFDEAPNEANMCLFGNLKMHVGDQLKQDTDFSSKCVKCICEVPPIPTCQRMPYDECD